MSLNQFNIGGVSKKIKNKKIYKKEKVMEKILCYKSVDEDLKIQIIRENYDELSVIYRCLIESNSDNIELLSGKTDLYEIAGMLFKQLETFGKVTNIELDGKNYVEKEINKVKFIEDGEVEIYLSDGDAIYTNVSDCDFETACFSADEYTEVLKELRLEINKIYQKHAA